MTSMKDAMKRLTVIHQACCPQENNEKPDMDEFTRIKKEIAAKVKEARQLIKERNDILKADKSSRRIRSVLKAIKEDINSLDANVQKAEKKMYRSRAKNKPDLQKFSTRAKKSSSVCRSHLEECENLDRERFNDKVAGDRANLFASGGGGAAASPSSALKFGKFGAAAVSPGMPPPSPGSSAIAEDLALIRQRNMDIDQELDEIAAGVNVIKQIAIQMGDELDKQNEMLDNIETKVDKANEHVAAVNEKMKLALDGS
ncbi:hypothetical protein BCR44DRAFT_1441118 [Catenaria anguillulae PL171]|uniref:t-SNARE coiled-coil homology domain-containing protein n=1 Tax=Catenaria anguillulae PL171 TaxID=765915 RepID=A0A1Y2HDQ1_9FUNG|nr:hypothetical protein BCR44DRAFT_1441118 [Catenaria anguillulae PL171]